MNAKTITNERGTWLQHDLAISLGSEIEDIREELAELQTRFERVMRDVRRLPGGQWLYDRVDAYPGVRLDRDMGAGQDADGWLAEVASILEALGDPEASRGRAGGPRRARVGRHRPPCPSCRARGHDRECGRKAEAPDESVRARRHGVTPSPPTAASGP